QIASAADCIWTRIFFQAEDGIRVGHVTGVQTCALPISAAERAPRFAGGFARRGHALQRGDALWVQHLTGNAQRARQIARPDKQRSEERRVGKESTSGLSRDGWNMRRMHTVSRERRTRCI